MVIFFWLNVSKNAISSLKQESEHFHETLRRQISLGTKFQLKLAIFIFWNKSDQKWFLQLQMKQLKFCPFEVDLVPNFSLNSQFCFLDQIAQKRLFPAENRKREHHHSNLHIWICLGTKIQLNWQLWLFRPH